MLISKLRYPVNLFRWRIFSQLASGYIRVTYTQEISCIKPCRKAGSLCDGAVLLSVCLFVCRLQRLLLLAARAYRVGQSGRRRRTDLLYQFCGDKGKGKGKCIYIARFS